MGDRTDIILENEGLIYSIINKYRNYFELEDLYQVAAMALLKAHTKYKEGHNAKFSSYAYLYVLGDVLKYVNEFRAIKVNRNYKMLYARILKASDTLTQKLMKNPTTYELSLFLELDEQLIIEVMTANSMVDSLDKIISEDGKNLELYDTLGYHDRGIESYSLHSELEKLSASERRIIEARYYDDMSQREIGDELGMYQVEVSRIEKKVLKRLHDNMAA